MKEQPAQKQDDGEPAFPMPSGKEPRVNETTHYNKGMSLRDYFAAKALQGFIASITSQEALDGFSSACAEHSKNPPEMHAFMAYAIADAMLAERSKNG